MQQERKRNRLYGYDYSQDNLYFITSCVKNVVCCFGEIIDNKMNLNKYGEIVDHQWYWMEKQYPHLTLHEFVVMPNHMHGIIEINQGNLDLEIVRTGRDLSVQFPDSPIKIKSLSELIGAFKMTSSKQIHLAGFSAFNWQRSFHDHIIRDERSFRNISLYIQNNPSAWDHDRFNDQ